MLDPSVAGLESSPLRPLLGAASILPDKSVRDDPGWRLRTAQSDQNALGEAWGSQLRIRARTLCAILTSLRPADSVNLVSVR